MGNVVNTRVTDRITQTGDVLDRRMVRGRDEAPGRRAVGSADPLSAGPPHDRVGPGRRSPVQQRRFRQARVGPHRVAAVARPPCCSVPRIHEAVTESFTPMPCSALRMVSYRGMAPGASTLQRLSRPRRACRDTAQAVRLSHRPDSRQKRIRVRVFQNCREELRNHLVFVEVGTDVERLEPGRALFPAVLVPKSRLPAYNSAPPKAWVPDTAATAPNYRPSLATTPARKHVVRWSFTNPVACRNA